MITLSDIAKRSGVSTATVSVVLNDRADSVRVKAATRQRVLDAASELGYRPNAIARAMVTGKNRVLGFLTSEPDYETAARMLVGALDEADAHQYFIKIMHIRNGDLNKQIMEQCVELRLAGIVALQLSDGTLGMLRTEMRPHRIPVAVLDSSYPQPWGIRVISDDIPGCRAAIEHLFRLGHRRIAYYSDSHEEGVGHLRLAGYEAAMQEFGLPIPAGYIREELEFDGTHKAELERLMFHSDAPPTALLCSLDALAMKMMRAASQLGMRVPEDLSVVGFADMAMAALANPPLTTVAQPFYEMGRVVVGRLLTAIDTNGALDDAPPLEERLPTTLVVRESCGPVNSARH